MNRTRNIIYWIATAWLCLGLASTGIVQLLHRKEELVRMQSLAYPPYLLTIIGTWKLLAIPALLLPRMPLLKEWAYAGCFFAMSCAGISHLICAHPFADIFPSLLLLVLTLVSWYFRPAAGRPYPLLNGKAQTL
ncbi:DoxX family protein [Rurimicrobium arvi]|uniref:DoxX family protein n=1 Tax=Rurimicrobium arvi TaxID=2049916 RepID=A0ABP8MSQ6_9BACT